MSDPSLDHRRAHRSRDVPVEAAPTSGATVLDVLAERAARSPDDALITEVGLAGRTSTMTVGQLHALSGQGATWLRDAVGAVPGTTIGVAPVNTLRSVVAIFSAMRAGLKVALLDPAAPTARREAILRALGAEAMIRDDGDREGTIFPRLDALPAARGAELGPRPSDDVFYIGTSGSTSTSKIVAQKHWALSSNAIAVRRHHRLGPGDRFLSCLPIHHVNGLHFTVMAPVFCGSHAWLVEGFDPMRFPAVIAEVAPRIVSVVPSLLEALAATSRARSLPDGFGAFVSAAAPLSQSLAQTIWERWGARVLQGYGLTETTNFSTTLPWNLSDVDYARRMLDAPIPSIGVAMEGNEIMVCDPQGNPVPPGQDGELCVRGHNVMDRYIGSPEETERAFRHGWFHTGDLGRALDDTIASPLVVTGRIKNVAKVRGESVSLEEMERHLLDCDGVVDAACTTVPDRFLGDAIIAIVVARAQLSDAVILQRLGDTFSRPSLPQRLLRVPSIPRSPTGKVLRPQVRSLVESTLGLR